MPVIVDISPAQLDSLIASGCALIDIRSTEDFSGGHVPGAVNVPANSLKSDPGRITSLLSDASSPALVLVCMRGHTSRRIAMELANAPGFTDLPGISGLDAIHSLDGGTVAWERSGRPLTDES